MEEERSQLLALFDFFWFHHHVLLDSPLPAARRPPCDTVPPAAAAARAETSSSSAPHMARQKSALHRSLSEEMAHASSSDSALLAYRPLKLETILSGKATSDEGVEHPEIPAQSGSAAERLEAGVDETNRGHRERKGKYGERRRTRTRTRTRTRIRGRSQDGQSKSLSELEFEELKGFIDLGFTFSGEDESDQRLLSIVPGLRRRGSSEEGVAKEAQEGEAAPEESAISRPYLSEAWDVLAEHQERRRSHAHDHLLRNWRVPAAGEGVDMKDHLRSWAHTVASAVQ